MAMHELTMSEIDDVSGGVTRGQVLNVGAGITAVGAAVLGGVGLIAGAPVLAAAGAAYGVVSAGMWLGGALDDMGWFNTP